MKAYVLHKIGDIRLENVAKPEPDRGEALVAVKAAGICGSDIPRVYRTGAYSYPLIPGHEFSGVVVKAGAGVEAGWLGQRVGVFPLIPCKGCLPCRNQQYEMCRHYSYLGSRRDGGFAEFVSVPIENVIRLPGNVSFEAAAMLEPMAVAVHALRRAGLATPDGPGRSGQTLAICGLGTIGLLLLMFLQEHALSNPNARYQILVIGNKDSQKRLAVEMGLPENGYCDSQKQDVGQWLKERTDGMGADIFFECVGKNETFVQALDHTAPGGNILLVGNPYSDMFLDRQVYWKILRNQLTVTGSWNSSFTHDKEDDWHYVLDRLERNRIAPDRLISHKLLFEDLEYGLRMMRDKSEDYVKVMSM